MAPPPPRWMMLRGKPGYAWNGVCYTIFTDVPCHLFVRWSDKRSTITHATRIIRGIPLACMPKFSIIRMGEIEQIQPGDTLVHTFPCKPPDPLHTFTIYGYGRIGGAWSPSTTGAIRVTNPVEPPPKNHSFDMLTWPLIHDWDRFCHSLSGGFCRAAYDLFDKVDGIASVHLTSLGYATLAAVQQYLDAVPYHYQTIALTGWGKGYAYSNNDLYLEQNGSGILVAVDQLTQSGVWQAKKATLYIPPDATWLKIMCRCYSGPQHSVDGRWDNIRIEIA